MSYEILDLIKQIMIKNKPLITNMCEKTTVNIQIDLNKIGVLNRIVSGDLIITNFKTKERKNFIQGKNRLPIGHSWIIFTIDKKNYLLENSLIEDIGPRFVTQLETENYMQKFLFGIDDFNLEYIYKNDGNNQT